MNKKTYGICRRNAERMNQYMLATIPAIWLLEMCLISKHYWLIKWLVSNDKIDFDNRDLKDEFMLEFERYPVFQGNTYNWDFNENGMIMLLSIQEDPVSFLINVLK